MTAPHASIPLASRRRKLNELVMCLDWTVEETEAAKDGEATKHLWEESWDDDDTSDDFSAQLK